MTVELSILRPEAARRVPWRNGRGTTVEWAIAPAGAEAARLDFDWRVSAAGVVEDGPFSAFPGYDRWIVVTDGEGMTLDHGGAAPSRSLRRGEPYRFDGAWPTSARLLDGPVADLNLMLRRGAAGGDLVVVPGGAEREVVLGAGVAFGFAVRGAWRVRFAGGDAFETPRSGVLQIRTDVAGVVCGLRGDEPDGLFALARAARV